MEIPAPVIFPILVVTGDAPKSVTVWIISGLYVLRCFNRAIVYPLRIRIKGKVMPLAVALMAVFFNFVSAGFLGYYTGSLHTHFNNTWLTDPRFIAGLAVFITGMAINITSDEKLINLRKNKSGGYQIPRGGSLKGFPARISLVKSSSGEAMPSLAGPCLPSPFSAGHSATLYQERSRITGGTGVISRNISGKEVSNSLDFVIF
ncbi:MAG: hypothetical protein WAV93_01825 [Bacteroidales bacterium]